MNFVRFKSDLVFIRDANWAKPYFKWFNYPDTQDNFKIVQEFFIPHQSFLNFEVDNCIDGIISTTWNYLIQCYNILTMLKQCF